MRIPFRCPLRWSCTSHGYLPPRVKVDESLRERLRLAAARVGCTPHWLHKQALLSYIEAVERGQVLPQAGVGDAETGEQAADVPGADVVPPFYVFAQDVQPQSVLRAAITAAYRRPETECVPVLLEQARSARPQEVQALARKLVDTLRSRRKSGIVEGLIQEFSSVARRGWH